MPCRVALRVIIADDAESVLQLGLAGEVGSVGRGIALDAHEFDIKDERGPTGNLAARSSVTVPEMRGDGEFSLFADTHVYRESVESRITLVRHPQKAPTMWTNLVVPDPILL